MNALLASVYVLVILLNGSLAFVLRLVYVPLYLADLGLAKLTNSLADEAVQLMFPEKQSTSQTPKDK